MMDGQLDIKRRLYLSKYVDCHCHYPDNAEVFALRSLDLAEYLTATKLPELYSVGIHPWHSTASSQSDLDRLINTSQLLAIGECGLDKAIAVPINLQMAVFEQQIALAAVWHKPLIIHCVRAYNELLMMKRAHVTGTAWLIHGCNCSFQQLQQLLKAGFYCSFGSRLMNPASKPAQYLVDLPIDCWLLETDADSRFGIDAIYSCAASILGWDVDALHQQMIKNFERIFLND